MKNYSSFQNSPFCLFVCFIAFGDRGFHCASQASFELTVLLLPWPPECWDYKGILPYLAPKKSSSPPPPQY